MRHMHSAAYIRQREASRAIHGFFEHDQSADCSPFRTGAGNQAMLETSTRTYSASSLVESLGQHFLGHAVCLLLQPAFVRAKPRGLTVLSGQSRARQELLRDARNAAVLPRHPALCKIMY